MRGKCVLVAALPLFCSAAFAQSDDRNIVLDSLEVIGTRAPLSPENSVRMVQVLDREAIARTEATSVNDLLRAVAGVDVRQRGTFGIQTDIGINGGSQDELTVLLNGVDISNSHTGHLTMDLPLSVDDIERIEVLEGGSSRVYGSSAFSGAINIVTKKATESNAEANMAAGSYGTASLSAAASVTSGAFSNRLSLSYARSDGGTDNSDFGKGSGFLRGGWSKDNIEISWQAGASTMNYGANTFYSPSYANQYEENRRYMAALSARMGSRIVFAPQIYWNRSLDHYLLKRDNPSFYENFHQLNIYGLNLGAYTQWSLGKTAFGAEIRSENILSNTLGKPLEEESQVKVPGHDAMYTKQDGRTLVSYYLEHDLLLGPVTVSMGLLANTNTGLDYRMRLYPGVDVSWNLKRGWKAYVSFNKALRMPTFTELYYKSPTINGNVGLKPEKSTDWALGLQYSSPALSIKAKAFIKNGTDMIDWVKYSASDTFHSANFRLDTYGLELNASLRLAELYDNPFITDIAAGYAYLYQDRRDEEEIYMSNYVMAYLRNKLTASLSHRIVRNVQMEWSFRLQHRTGSFEYYEDCAPAGELRPYGTNATLDAKIMWKLSHETFYVQASNLTANRYYDLGNVLQPGLWVMAGVRLALR